MSNGKGLQAGHWIGVLGAVGFVTGFFGPLIFVPEANQGPLVGIFISGPAGAALGCVLYVACRLLSVGERGQRRLLLGTAALGFIAVVIGIQPSPELRGTLYDGEVKACGSPHDAEAETLQFWKEKIAEVTWSAPRPSWEQDMRETLRNAPGILVSVEITRQNSVYENRKPWNSGSIFASGWKSTSDVKSYYYAEGSCDEFPAGQQVHGFQKYDLNGRIEPPKAWPPKDFKGVIHASMFSAVPEAYKAF